MRGEYNWLWTTILVPAELPPRARRIRRQTNQNRPETGTTSACAENTYCRWLRKTLFWNYLRVRGEYLWRAIWWVPPSELPPRARRIHPRGVKRLEALGTTSACAENTEFIVRHYYDSENSLRVRGEYVEPSSRNANRLELPPRARRIPQLGNKSLFMHGTTSACAENTQ